MTEPRTLTEAVNLGKVYGIETAETIMALAIAKAFESKPINYIGALSMVRQEFKELCRIAKADIDKPVTEEEKRKLTES